MQCISPKPLPRHLPGDQLSLHLSLTPITARSTSLCSLSCHPGARRAKFCLFQPLSPSPGAGKGSGRREFPPLTPRSLPSRSWVLSQARGSTRKVGQGCRE